MLKKGDKIGIVAPSFFIEKDKQFNEGINYLKNMGFIIEFGKTVYEKHYSTTGTAIERAKDINEMFINPEIKAIFASDGGCNAIELLSLLDYEKIRENPKIFTGFSDITHINLALYAKSNIKAIHGLDIINGLGNFDNMTREQNVNYFFQLISKKSNTLIFPQMTQWQIIKEGKAKGIALGGWLDAINNLNNTEYFPKDKNIILFWEAVDLELNKINMLLNSLRVSGLFEKVVGMVIGALTNCEEKEYFDCIYPFKKIIDNVTAGYNFPIICNVNFGHRNENTSFIIGSLMSIDTENLEIKTYGDYQNE